MSEINVVPYIDVMLVLLVIFMITAPLLNLGVEVELPKADAEPLDTQQNDEPMVLTVLMASTVLMVSKLRARDCRVSRHQARNSSSIPRPWKTGASETRHCPTTFGRRYIGVTWTMQLARWRCCLPFDCQH